LSLLFWGRETETVGKTSKLVLRHGAKQGIEVLQLLDATTIQSRPGLLPETGLTLFWQGFTLASSNA
jgi:hypothetical protein